MKVVWFKSDKKHSASLNHIPSMMHGRVLCGQYIANWAERIQYSEFMGVDCAKCKRMNNKNSPSENL